MLLFAKALWTSSASPSIFLMSLLGLQLQMEQPQLVTSLRFFYSQILFSLSQILLSTITRVTCLFLFFQLNPFVARHISINKVIVSFNFVQCSFIRPSVLNDIVCLDIKITRYFDPIILNCTFRFAIIPKTFPTNPNFWHFIEILSCLCLYSFWASFLLSSIKWVIESSLSPLLPYFSDISNMSHQCSFLSSLFWELVLMLQISSLPFLSSSNPFESIPICPYV